MLQEYLHNWNSRLPLFNPEILYTLFEDCYSGANDGKPLAWVLVYVALAIAYRMRAISLFAAPDDASNAEWMFATTLSRLPEMLTTHPPCNELVQAYAGMTCLLETSGNCKRASLFASTALGMASELGSNEITPDQLTTSDKSKEMAYCFWIAFSLDSHFSIAGQRQSAQRLADIITPLPNSDAADWWNPLSIQHASDSDWNLNPFSQHATLAIIEAEAAEELLSAKARRRTAPENAKIYQNLSQGLQHWRQNNALSKLAPSEVLTSMYRSDIVHAVMLEGQLGRSLTLDNVGAG